VAAFSGRRCITTFVAGLQSTGIVAPLALDRSMTGEAFRVDVDEVPVLALLPEDVVVLDTLPAHQVAGVWSAIEARGQHPLPAVLTRLEPGSRHHCGRRRLEQAFAKLKAGLHKAVV